MMKDNPTVVELLQELVRIPSVNPAGDPGTEGVGEGNVAHWLAGFFQEHLRAEVELQEILPGRPNLIAKLPRKQSSARGRILLAPHTDTVSVRGMTIDPFGAELRDGRVYGRGTCDTKGTIAAMMRALLDMGDAVTDSAGEIWFVGLMGEEAGHTGVRALAPTVEADFALVGEPTERCLVYTHKGSLWLRLVARGKSAHSSRPDLGENALYKMADVLRFIRDDLAADLARTQDPVLGHPTCNAGVISGGSKINIVPEHCEVELDIRTVPEIHDQELANRISDQLRQSLSDLEVEVIHEALALQTPAENPFVRLFSDHGVELIGAPWFCDASILAAHGIPSAAGGPGSIQQAHTADEWISVEELEKGVDFYRAFLDQVSADGAWALAKE